MPRKERPLDDGDTAVLSFARELRSLRERAGMPTYRRLSSLTHYSEAALSQAAGGRKLPTLQVTLAYVRACGGSEEEWERRWYATAADEPQPEPDTTSPYRGLAAFQQEDADRFFGRAQLVDELEEQVGEHRVVLVVGASGAGKSSLLRAGLMPRLGDRAVLITPGRQPLDECAKATAGTVLVVDQFEEIFTLCENREIRRKFVEQITEHRVVLGVRADFYGHCTDFPALVKAMGTAQVTVGPMTTDELRAAIIQPARTTGHAVETALVAELVANCVEQAGALPLLSHALLETWHRRKGNTLTLQGFRAAGGFEGALTRTAESAFQSLTPAQQDLAKSLFIRLTAVGENTEDTKRRICRSELDDEPDTALVLEALTAHRLITVDQDRVEITHEALIRCWPRLKEWLAADRDGLRAHRDLAEAAAVWESLDRDPGSLIRGARLASFRSWLDRPAHPLSARERDFLTASLTAETAGRRRLQLLVGLLTVLLIATTGVSIAALRATSEATEQRNNALSQKVAQDAERLHSADPALAAQLALAAYRLAPTQDARSALLSSFTPAYATKLTAHRDNVNAVAHSPRRQLLASSSRDRTVRLTDVADPHHPREVATLSGHTDNVAHVAFSSDGTMLATAAWDRTARLWDTTTGNLLATLNHADRVNAVAFSGDSHVLATASSDKTVRLWDLTTPEPRRTAAFPHPGAVISLAFSPTSPHLAAGTWDGTARLWDLAGTHRDLPGKGPVHAVAVSQDGKQIATSNDRTVQVWPVEGGEPRVLSGHSDTVRGLAFSPDGRLASTGVDRTVRIWDQGDPLVLAGHTAAVVGATFLGTALATASDDHTVRLWDLPGNLLQAHSDSVYSVATHGSLIATGSYDRTVKLWQDGKLLTVLNGPNDAVNTVRFSPDGKTLLAASADHRVHRWRITGRPEPLPALEGHSDAVNTLAVSPDGELIATGSTDRTIVVWDARTGTSLGTLPGHADSVEALAFSPDSRLLASGSGDFSVRIWDVAGRKVVSHLTGQSHAVKSVAFSPDGKELATGSTDFAVRLWDVATGTRTAELTGHTDTVHAVAFSPDGRTLASAAADHDVRLWRLADRTPLATLSDHAERVYALAFTPDGNALLSASGDRTVRRWEADEEHASQRICAAASPPLTQDHWTRYLPDVDHTPICSN
ncbi:nSTAND1 domain-containing NTPase [Lentzea terrae]|uniref:nSTAND1 domain-containing NTPase n=1 Tax=Lentzea terrae TaxID=2200761 RepID=UPI000DD32CD6|nr:helix-turn-helix domain-containing protein [Lentzea terrae]